MRRLRMAGTVVAGACAAALTVSLAACTPASPADRRVAVRDDLPQRRTRPPTPPGTSRAHATGIESGHGRPGPTGRPGSVRAARLLRSALADPDAIAAAGSDVWVANSADESGGRGWVSEFSAASGALIRVIAGPGTGSPIRRPSRSTGTASGWPTGTAAG